MLQQKKPDDFVISTGREYSVKEFINLSYKQIGINLVWKGKGTDEYAINKSTKKKLVKINKKYFRPNEVNRLRGNNLKARKILKWKPRTTIIQLIKEMLAHEIKKIKKSKCVLLLGHKGLIGSSIFNELKKKFQSKNSR